MVKEIDKYFGLPIDSSFFSCKIGDFFSLKCKTPEFLLTNVVYKFQCFLDENTAYVGKTDRHLVTRISEHLDPKKKSAVTKHLADCPACRHHGKKQFSVLKKCRDDNETRVQEALLIREIHPLLNVQLHNSGAGTLLHIF